MRNRGCGSSFGGRRRTTWGTGVNANQLHKDTGGGGGWEARGEYHGERDGEGEWLSSLNETHAGNPVEALAGWKPARVVTVLPLRGGG